MPSCFLIVDFLLFSNSV